MTTVSVRGWNRLHRCPAVTISGGHAPCYSQAAACGAVGGHDNEQCGITLTGLPGRVQVLREQYAIERTFNETVKSISGPSGIVEVGTKTLTLDESSRRNCDRDSQRA